MILFRDVHVERVIAEHGGNDALSVVSDRGVQVVCGVLVDESPTVLIELLI